MKAARDSIPRENAGAVMAVHRARDAARKRGHGGHFEIEDMAPFFDDYFLTRSRVQLDCGLISHRAGGHEDRRLFFKDLSRALLQPIYSRVFAVNIVANFGFGHGPAHGRGWFGNSVAA